MAGTNSNFAVFFSGVFLLAVAYVVFRVIVRRDYRLHGRLTGWSSTLQLLAFAGLMAFPYLFNPPEWALSWMLAGPTSFPQQILGLVIILLGFLVAFGTMGWFGMRRAFGLEAKGLIILDHIGLQEIPKSWEGTFWSLGLQCNGLPGSRSFGLCFTG
jgi:hypothetical protein